MKGLFGNDLSINTGTEPNLSIEFKDATKGIYFSFEDTGDTGNDYELTYYQVFSDQSNVTINGLMFTVGNTINNLTNVNIDHDNNQIVYNTPKESSSIIVKFNRFNKKITSITYEVFT